MWVWNQFTICVGIFLDCVPFLNLYSRTTLSWWLQLHKKSWNHIVYVFELFQNCFSCSLFVDMLICFRISLRYDDCDLTALTASRNLALDICSYSARLMRPLCCFLGLLLFHFSYYLPHIPYSLSSLQLWPLSFQLNNSTVLLPLPLSAWLPGKVSRRNRVIVGFCLLSSLLRDHHTVLPIAS